ncbi:MAG: hypothetical protein HN337_00665 [Deltaproteobacteria bacterium]|nr:hypothetical protein [Deltaproteobacteria bacterium]
MSRRSPYCLLIILAFFVGCGGAASGPSTPTDIPIALEGVEGATDVDVSSSFAYTFSKAVDTETVTTDTFYIVAGDGEDSCDSDDAIDASVECSSNTECTLDPTEDLTESVQYTVCLEAGSASASISPTKESTTSGIFYADGEAFEGDSITFITATTMTLTLCSEIYSSDTCSWDGMSEPDEGDTFSYSDMEFIADNYGMNETHMTCICQLSNSLGYSGCTPFTSTFYDTCIAGSSEPTYNYNDSQMALIADDGGLENFRAKAFSTDADSSKKTILEHAIACRNDSGEYLGAAVHGWDTDQEIDESSACSSVYDMYGPDSPADYDGLQIRMEDENQEEGHFGLFLSSYYDGSLPFFDTDIDPDDMVQFDDTSIIISYDKNDASYLVMENPDNGARVSASVTIYRIADDETASDGTPYHFLLLIKLIKPLDGNGNETGNYCNTKDDRPFSIAYVIDGRCEA